MGRGGGVLIMSICGLHSAEVMRNFIRPLPSVVDVSVMRISHKVASRGAFFVIHLWIFQISVKVEC